MADFEGIIKKFAGEDGAIPAEAVAKAVQAVASAVGREFVDKSRYNAKLEEIETLKAEKQTAEDSLATASKWKDKHDALKTEFDTYKAAQAAQAQQDKVKAAYRKLLAESKVADKHMDVIMRVTDFDKMKLADDGTLEGADALKTAIANDWSDFIVTSSDRGADVPTPPKDQSGAKPHGSGLAAKIAAKYQTEHYGAPAKPEKTE